MDIVGDTTDTLAKSVVGQYDDLRLAEEAATAFYLLLDKVQAGTR